MMRHWLRTIWNFIRELSGDDAYERYLARHNATHPEIPPLSRSQFFVREEERRWGGINRCC
jgi:uncharacterized short protein YbdD (DUF466 family)